MAVLLLTKFYFYRLSYRKHQNHHWVSVSSSSLLLLLFNNETSITVFAGVLFVHQLGANHAPGASVTQVNHSVYTISTFLRIRADPSMQIF